MESFSSGLYIDDKAGMESIVQGPPSDSYWKGIGRVFWPRRNNKRPVRPKKARRQAMD